MQLCESCGACRENEWRLCPFCRASLTTIDPPASNDSERFDAMAAATETSDLDVLPSLMNDDQADPEPDSDLLTAQDLAHLTGDGGPAVNGWDSPAPTVPAPPAETTKGIDAPVSKAVVAPLVAVALVAVAFVAYSILTAPTPTRPDTVALIDRPATTVMSTTTTEPPAPEPGVVGIDLAEQAARLCAGDQFGIARAQTPSLAVYNDLLTATRDGRESWTAPADHVTLRDPIPSLIGCLTTADGGEIDRCPTDGPIISRRSVMWTYRVLQSVDGTALGGDEGTATDLRSCEELLAEAGGADTSSWSPLPQDRLHQVAAAYTTAPHPQIACAAEPVAPEGADTGQASFDQGLSLHATFAGVTDVDVPLPEGWMATEERPVEAVLCLEYVDDATSPDSPTNDSPINDSPTNDSTPSDDTEAPPAAEGCEATIRASAVHRDGRVIGSWDYISSICPERDETVNPPNEWWIDVVGPALGYPVASSEGE